MSTQPITVPAESKAIEFVPFGAAESIKLSVSIVKTLVAVPTRSGKVPDDRDCIKFMMLCRARHLNPFEGDAFLLGYDTQHGPQFSLITAHQVFLKRAEASKDFDGMESGVIVRDADDHVLEREGDFTFKDESLLGGWAKVYRKDRTKPIYRRLKLETFSSGRSRWEKDPAGMIVKCAEADALRSSFPTHLGGLYMREENPPIDLVEIPQARIGNKQTPLEEPKQLKSAAKVEKAEPNPQDGTTKASEAQGEYLEGGDPEGEEVSQEPPPDEEKKGPTSAELKKKIIGEMANLNIGKVRLNKELAALGILEAGQNYETADAATLLIVTERWDELVQQIRNA
jgi:phage recombination protein Bet